MNQTQNKNEQPDVPKKTGFKYPIHPYFKSNNSEETLKRMKEFPERAARFLEQWRANREKSSR